MSLVFVNQSVGSGLHEADRVERGLLRCITFALHNDLVIPGFQVPIPLVIGVGLPNLKIHKGFSFL